MRGAIFRYELYGDHERLCDETVQWSGAIPKCRSELEATPKVELVYNEEPLKRGNATAWRCGAEEASFDYSTRRPSSEMR